MKPHERIFVALDTSDPERARALARALAGRVGGFKVGLEAFSSCGPALVGEVLSEGLPGFLDLKPVLLAIAERHGLEYAFVHETSDDGSTTSDWVLLTRWKPLILRPEIVAATEPVAPQPGWRLWTDAYNNLLQVWRR